MKSTLYMETSVLSYLTGRSTNDLAISARQFHTHLWWEEKRKNFKIFVSRLVWDEAAKGDSEKVEQRMKILKGLPSLQLNSESARLARALIAAGALPQKAVEDAIHLALAAVHNIHFLATWNLKHINNPAVADKMRDVCQASGFHCPVICTPEELLFV